MKQIRLFYGVRTNSIEDLKASIRAELRKCDVEVLSDMVRDMKAGIRYELEKAPKDAPVVLVISYRLDGPNEPFTISELISYQKIVPGIRIIVIIAKQDKEVLPDFFSNGIYDAIVDTEVDMPGLAGLIAKGRTIDAARAYYEIDKNTSAADKITFDEAYRIVTQAASSDGVYVERVGWAKDKISEAEFIALLDKLPDNIKDILSVTEEYAKYYEEYIARKVGSGRVVEETKPQAVYDATDVQLLRGVLSNVLMRSMIAVASAQEHVGSTHNAISIAHYLSEKGYKVGIVEYANQTNLSFHYMAEEHGFRIKDGRFTWKSVDYYPEFSFKDLARLNGQGYNFLVVDFGLLTKDKLYDFTCCVMQNIITGSRIWETVKLENIFSMVEKSLLVNCNFLFYSAPTNAKTGIAKKMEPLRVFFIDYDVDPFDGEVSTGIEDVFEDFVLTKSNKEPEKKSLLGGFKKIWR